MTIGKGKSEPEPDLIWTSGHFCQHCYYPNQITRSFYRFFNKLNRAWARIVLPITFFDRNFALCIVKGLANFPSLHKDSQVFKSPPNYFRTRLGSLFQFYFCVNDIFDLKSRCFLYAVATLVFPR